MYTLVLAISAIAAGAQTVYSDEVAGFSVNIPDGWVHEKFEKGELALRCSGEEGTAFYDVNLKKLSEGQTAKQYMEYLESYMPDAGFSANFMPEENRQIDGSAYGADEVYGGAYSKEKNGIQMGQIIFIYRKGAYAYMTIQTCELAKMQELVPVYDVFYGSFKLQ